MNSEGEDGHRAAKKIKLDVEERDNVPRDDFFSDFSVVKILSENAKQKCLFLHGRFGDNPDDAVLLLEKTPFCPSSISDMLRNKVTATVSLKNDIYKTLELCPSAPYNGMKSTLIYPATEKHLRKYTSQTCYIVNESPDDYEHNVLPYIQSSSFSRQWVYNILDKKSEVERIIFEDPDMKTGFILVPDMKWDEKQLEDLYAVALVQDRSLHSIRSLTAEHIALLENIQKKGLEAIEKRYGVKSCSVRVYFHYAPSYYHLHVHFTHVNYDSPGTVVGKAHLLNDVIDSLRLMSDFYQRRTLTCILREHDELCDIYRKSGRSLTQ